jgi:hypothetical protein
MMECDERVWCLLYDMPSVRLTDAATLALNIAPSQPILKALENAFEAYRPSEQKRATEKLISLVGKDRAELALGILASCRRWACVNEPGALETFTDETLYQRGTRSPFGGGFCDCRVRLSEFAAFCARQNWKIPDELAAFALDRDVHRPTPFVGRWPWGAHETELLRHMAEAGKKFWALYDPTDPSTAPTNKQIEDWLQARGVAIRIAEVMATILRADGLRPGPRK